jgi:large subunit ribosomal protein L24
MASNGKNRFNCILMKKEFSTKWKASKRKAKQRKYAFKAPLHLKKKLLSSNLSKELREKYQKRNLEIRKEDKVRIMRGKFKGKIGKIIEVKVKSLKVYVEGIQKKKQDGSKVNLPLKASNLQIIEVNDSDKKRFKKVKKEAKTSEVKEKKK